MRQRVLLIEPYELVAKLLVEVLAVLDYESDVVISGDVQESDLRAKEYYCVLINLDQNIPGWPSKGLRLAEMASKIGLPVVMIPGHQTAIAEIEANGWLHFAKPFTLDNVEHVLRTATSAPADDEAGAPPAGEAPPTPVARCGNGPLKTVPVARPTIR